MPEGEIFKLLESIFFDPFSVPEGEIYYENKKQNVLAQTFNRTRRVKSVRIFALNATLL